MPMKRHSSALGSSFPTFKSSSPMLYNPKDELRLSPTSVLSQFCVASSSQEVRAWVPSPDPKWWWTTSAHKFFGSPVASIMARAPSMCVRLARSAALLEEGESWTVRCRTVPAFAKVFSKLIRHKFTTSIATENSYRSTPLDFHQASYFL